MCEIEITAVYDAGAHYTLLSDPKTARTVRLEAGPDDLAFIAHNAAAIFASADAAQNGAPK